MAHYKYLAIGGSMTADAAIASIRKVDPAGPIGVIGAEPHPPYNRPPLTKALWKGEPFDSIWRRSDRPGLTLHLGRTARTLDARAKTVTDDQGTTYTFDVLLLATGGTPRRLPFGGDAIVYFRTVDDYRRLRALVDRGGRFVVIGGGFIGSEIAAALAMNGVGVTMLLRGEGIGAGTYPPALLGFLTRYYAERGVEVITGDAAVDAAPRGDRVAVRTRGGREILADGVVAGIGIEPNVALAREAGLETADGIVVDAFLRTGHPDIYAAGDVANFPAAVLGVRTRVEHEDNALSMGAAAGRLMAGERTPYDHLPFFYSDLFDLGYEAVGELDARHEIVEDWKEPYREGVVYYLREGRVRGVLLWNTWKQVDAATRLIAERGPFRPADLRRRIPAA